MRLGRLSNGEWISCGSAILLLAFMFFRWYGLEQQSNLLSLLRLFEEGGNAWQTLDALPVFLVLVVTITVTATLMRLIGTGWEPGVRPGLVICTLGVMAALAILSRIVFPPDLGAAQGAPGFETTLKTGIYLALGAACGVAFGGFMAMREEGPSFARSPRHVAE